MALDAKRVFESRQAAKYTGQNSADFNTEISDFTIVSETANGLSFTSGGQQYSVIPNGYISWYAGQVTDVFQNTDDYHDAYAELDSEHVVNHVHSIQTGPGHLVGDDN